MGFSQIGIYINQFSNKEACKNVFSDLSLNLFIYFRNIIFLIKNSNIFSTNLHLIFLELNRISIVELNLVEYSFNVLEFNAIKITCKVIQIFLFEWNFNLHKNQFMNWLVYHCYLYKQPKARRQNTSTYLFWDYPKLDYLNFFGCNS